MDCRPKWKTQTIKFLKNNIGRNLSNIGFSNDFLEYNTEVQTIKEKIGK